MFPKSITLYLIIVFRVLGETCQIYRIYQNDAISMKNYVKAAYSLEMYKYWSKRITLVWSALNIGGNLKYWNESIVSVAAENLYKLLNILCLWFCGYYGNNLPVKKDNTA